MRIDAKRAMRADPAQVDALCDYLASMRASARALCNAATEVQNRGDSLSAQPDAAPIWRKLERGFLDASFALALCADDAQRAMLPSEQHSGTSLKAPGDE